MLLPMSRLNVQFRLPDGNDDLALVEAGGSVTERSLVAITRLSVIESGSADGWQDLTVTDFETALLGLRQFLLGDRLSCQFRCSAPDCGERMEIELSIRELLASVDEEIAGDLPRGVREVPERPGWYSLGGKDRAEFRLVTVGDQLQVGGARDAMRTLLARCAELASENKRGVDRLERAMEAMAPLVSRAIAGTCAACGAPVSLQLHVAQLVMEELRAAAAGVHREVHRIAEAYHWSEATILAMPQARRRMYSEMIEELVA